MKVKELTKEQESMLVKYKEMAIKVGLATGDGTMDEALVRSLTDNHRVLCGLNPATNFIVEDSPFAVLRKYRSKDGPNVNNALYGQHDVNWLYYYAFYRVECGLVGETDGIQYLLELTKHVNWMWMNGDTTIVTHRPTSIHLLPQVDGLSRLHNPNGLALSYKDGEGVFALRGIRFPANLSWFFTPNKDESFGPKIMAVTNSELRSEMIKVMGPEFFSKYLPKKTINVDSTETGGEYELYEITIEGTTRRYLTGVCPSKGDRWHEAVHPDCKTVAEANSWRYYGTISSTYLEPRIAT